MLLFPVSQKGPARGSNKFPIPKVEPKFASMLILIGKCNRNENETGDSS
jgi:hypothetical protein